MPACGKSRIISGGLRQVIELSRIKPASDPLTRAPSFGGEANMSVENGFGAGQTRQARVKAMPGSDGKSLLTHASPLI